VSLDDVSNKLDLHSCINKIISNVHLVQMIWSVDKTDIDDLYQIHLKNLQFILMSIVVGEI